MGVPGAEALQPLLAACTLEHIALHVSGGVLGGTEDSAGGGASAVLADGLRRNTTFTSMRFSARCSKPVTIDTRMTAADFRNKGLCPAGTQVLAAFISRDLFQAEGHLASLNLSGNKCFGMWDKTAIESLAAAIAASTSISELYLADTGIDADDAAILVPLIHATLVLSKFDISGNKCFGNKGTRTPFDERPVPLLFGNQKTRTPFAAALSKSTTIAELNLAGNAIDPDCARMLAPAILVMVALKSLTFGDGESVVTIDTTMTKADFSGKKLGPAEAEILVAFMSTKLFGASGALCDLNLADNALGPAGAKIAAETILKW
jgi:hypothetical protein